MRENRTRKPDWDSDDCESGRLLGCAVIVDARDRLGCMEAEPWMAGKLWDAGAEA